MWPADDRRLLAAYPLPRPLLLEIFAAANLAFLAVDVSLAHTANFFRDPLEWVPVLASAACTVALAVGLFAGRPFHEGAGRWIGLAVGCLAVGVGVAGVVLHLQSQFFQALTLRALVYSAPFAAPLAYAGLGLLVLLNRMVPAESAEWGWWIMFLALGGFVGNLALSLSDHAQNGFFNALEWIPVVVSAIAVAFFGVAMTGPKGRPFVMALALVLLLQATTGVLGFGLHLLHLFRGEIAMRDRVLYGAPPFAPLLFADLALLGALGVWDLVKKGVLGGEAIHATVES